MFCICCCSCLLKVGQCQVERGTISSFYPNMPYNCVYPLCPLLLPKYAVQLCLASMHPNMETDMYGVGYQMTLSPNCCVPMSIVWVSVQGTAERLMQHLVEDHSTIDPTYVEDFLLTYRTFLPNPLHLANNLLQWFENPTYRPKVATQGARSAIRLSPCSCSLVLG